MKNFGAFILFFGTALTLSFGSAVAQDDLPDVELPEKGGAGISADNGFVDAGVAGEREPGLNLLTKVTRENGNVVEFYEPSPGFILMSEAGKVPNKPLDIQVRGMTAVDLFRYLAPGQSIPTQLLSAQEREDVAGTRMKKNSESGEHSDDVRQGGVRSVVASEKGSPAAVDNHDAACPKSWWETTIACSIDADWDVEWYSIMGRSWFLRNDSDWVRVGACSYRGTVTLKFQYRPWWDWHTQGTWTVNEGFYRTVWRMNSSVDFDIKSTVYNASGDGYHHCGWGYR
jgi:hypothetical protein